MDEGKATAHYYDETNIVTGVPFERVKGLSGVRCIPTTLSRVQHAGGKARRTLCTLPVFPTTKEELKPGPDKRRGTIEREDGIYFFAPIYPWKKKKFPSEGS